jgi:copper homeostasis protein
MPPYTEDEIQIEVVCTNVEDCRIAEYAGASRLELCSCIELGGLTPSVGIFQEAKRWCKTPIYVLIRPRPGLFSYSWKELATMRIDVDLFRKLGADGIAIGTLTESREVQTEACRYLIEAAGSMKRIFHRAFDLAADPFQALDRLIELGFDRVLTSGQQVSAVDGIPLIQQLIEYADSRIEIVPSGGIRSVNAREVLEISGAGQLHLGPYQTSADPDKLTELERMYGVHRTLNGTEVTGVIQSAHRTSFRTGYNRKRIATVEPEGHIAQVHNTPEIA